MKAFQAREFFLKCLAADCDKICVENPVPLHVVDLPPCDQVIQPFYFGEPYKKTTCLWLKGLPPLKATKILIDYRCYLPSNCSKNAGTDYNRGAASSAKIRSRTFEGIAAAMAEQWG